MKKYCLTFTVERKNISKSSSIMKLTGSKIKKKVSNINFEKGSKITEFIKRKGGKVTAELYVTSFFFMLLSKENTLFQWTMHMARLVDKFKLSEQGLERKLQIRHEKFAKWLLFKCLQLELSKELEETTTKELGQTGLKLESFNRVLLQDSTCINVPKNLAKIFPSSYTKSGKSATARIQLTMNLLSDSYEDISLGSFRDNDGKASPDILDIIEVGDLVLRDKGYWSLAVFEALDNKNAYFISRLKYGVNLYEIGSKTRMNLGKFLKKAKKNNQTTIDKEIEIGSKHRLKVRLVAILLPEKIADSRKRKAKNDRHSKVNHSEEYYQRLEWCIFMTNVPSEVLDKQLIAKVYRLRWRIEIIFKVWKSKFEFDELFNKQSMNPSRAIITFYLALAWLTLFFVSLYSYFLINVYRKTGRYVSIFKFAGFLITFMKEEQKQEQIINHPEDFIDFVASTCLYDKRKRKNQMQLIYC